MFRTITVMSLLMVLVLTSIGQAQMFRRARTNQMFQQQQQQQFALQQMSMQQRAMQQAQGARNGSQLYIVVPTSQPHCAANNQLRMQVQRDRIPYEQLVLQQMQQQQMQPAQQRLQTIPTNAQRNCAEIQRARQLASAQQYANNLALQQQQQQQRRVARNTIVTNPPATNQIQQTPPQRRVVSARPNYDANPKIRTVPMNSQVTGRSRIISNQPSVAPQTSQATVVPSLNAPVQVVREAPGIAAPKSIVEPATEAVTASAELGTIEPEQQTLTANVEPQTVLSAPAAAEAKDESFEIVEEGNEADFFNTDDLMLEEEQDEPVPAENSDAEILDDLDDVPPLVEDDN